VSLPHPDWLLRPLVVIDVETTGTDYFKDRVVEVALVLVDHAEVTATHVWKCNPQMPIPAEATSVHGIKDEDVAGHPTFAELVTAIENLAQSRLPVAYNARFDRSFFHAELLHAGLENRPFSAWAFQARCPWIDPYVWVKEFQKYERGKKLGDVCRRLGITIAQAHRADADAIATLAVLKCLARKMPTSIADIMRAQVELQVKQDADFAEWKAKQDQKGKQQTLPETV
jgi:DNA polymerase III subunit epsilon